MDNDLNSMKTKPRSPSPLKGIPPPLHVYPCLAVIVNVQAVISMWLSSFLIDVATYC